MTTTVADAVISHPHILLTALITGAITLPLALWRLGRHAWTDAIAVTLITGAAVWLWRTSANLPQLNTDGLRGFSANDWLAPVLTYVALSLYTALRPARDLHRYNQARALAVLAALAVNVIVI
ncbi:hypothetical protein C5E45_01155 [Nocardia nova]|uniref:Uncharacterized protein n=1 Tax=Nocardia nova TaxID=37330 RepID=A0A2S6AX44_9NOCA|nr:hypothetical protein [Nocardia nova]PPJ39780.1 hypothetical protein C5E45_01155 [Nocardia nova]